MPERVSGLRNLTGVDPLSVLSETARAERARLVAVARREGLGAEDAVDCVQDAFCTYLRLVSGGETPHDAGAWLRAIVRNGARNKRRSHHVARPHEPIREDHAAVPEQDVARAEEHVRLRACVEQLCDTQRAVVTLRMLEEKPGEDVAAALGITRGYVDVLLHRARASLFACMTE
jgi:RNA polymerase sigma-70 factor (ECF subfamily)